MTDLVVWLRTQLDTDEQLALAATPGPWWHNPGKQWLGPEAFERYDVTKGEEFVGYGGPSPFTGAVASTGPASHAQSMSDAAFIAANDPARVLRQVQAHRAILDGIAMRLDPSEPYGGWEHADAETDGMASNTLRALASIYSDRDGYKEEWSA